MAFKDGAGNGKFPALRYAANGTKDTFSVLPVSPVSGDRYPSLGVTIVGNASSVPTQNLDIAWQVATDSAFTNLVYTQTTTNVQPGERSIMVSGLTSGTRYYWRARATPTGTTTWGPWSTVWSFIPDLNSGNAFGYVPMNIGVELTLDKDVTSTGQVEENTGIEIILDRDVTATNRVEENIGAEITIHHDVTSVEPVYEGDVNTLTPTPHIWFLRPNSGRSGDGIQIICFGAGDLQNTFNGVVEIYKGLIEGWTPVSVTTWQVFPPSANAYTENRKIDPWNFIIDMQHQIIEITVPSGTVPPGHSLRIRTNGP